MTLSVIYMTAHGGAGERKKSCTIFVIVFIMNMGIFSFFCFEHNTNLIKKNKSGTYIINGVSEILIFGNHNLANSLKGIL